MPTIDVVIPCYNASRYLRQALDSVAAQTLQPGQVFVVDDGSIDDSVEIARASGATVLSTGNNCGPATARNLGCESSSADLIAFLDADDYWEPDHLRALATSAAAVPDAAVLYSEIAGSAAAYPTSINLRGELMRGVNPIVQSAVAVRRDAFTRVGGYDRTYRYAEDYELWLRLSRTESFASSGTATTHYRLHGEQLTQQLDRLVADAWRARAHEFRWLQSRSSAAEIRAASAALQEAWCSDMEHAWRRRDRQLVQQLLHLAPSVPESERVLRWWRRHHWRWRVWMVIGRLSEAMPPGTRHVVRSLAAWRRKSSAPAGASKRRT